MKSETFNGCRLRSQLPPYCRKSLQHHKTFPAVAIYLAVWMKHGFLSWPPLHAHYKVASFLWSAIPNQFTATSRKSAATAVNSKRACLCSRGQTAFVLLQQRRSPKTESVQRVSGPAGATTGLSTLQSYRLVLRSSGVPNRPHKKLLFVEMFIPNVPFIISTLFSATGQRRGQNADVYLICVFLGWLQPH